MPAQVRPQAPQLRALLFRFTHDCPQRVSLLGQAATQPPRLQNCPAGQARPHMPQLAGSICRSAQPPGHWVCPGVQMLTHWPSMQASPGSQAIAQVTGTSRLSASATVASAGAASGPSTAGGTDGAPPAPPVAGAGSITMPPAEPPRPPLPPRRSGSTPVRPPVPPVRTEGGDFGASRQPGASANASTSKTGRQEPEHEPGRQRGNLDMVISLHMQARPWAVQLFRFMHIRALPLVQQQVLPVQAEVFAQRAA
jgi:hypothetical protein